MPQVQPQIMYGQVGAPAQPQYIMSPQPFNNLGQVMMPVAQAPLQVQAPSSIPQPQQAPAQASAQASTQTASSQQSKEEILQKIEQIEQKVGSVKQKIESLEKQKK